MATKATSQEINGTTAETGRFVSSANNWFSGIGEGIFLIPA
jgi:hypothetical protein